MAVVDNAPGPATADDASHEVCGILVEKTGDAILEAVAHNLASYVAGKPLFCRALLEDLDRQLDLGKDFVRINDYGDVSHEYSLMVPDWCKELATTYRIHYGSIQSITCFDPNRELEILGVELRPLSISYTNGNDTPPQCSYLLTREAFDRHYQNWRNSRTWIALKEYLVIECRSGIDNIVCFGLGPPAGEDGRDTDRSLTQHAAAKAIAEELNALTGSKISCYAQDPAYTDVDKEVLRSIGITPLNDPKGFLRVDKNTLVLSVSPNVPVKQIISDLQWPAAMLWNTILPEKEEKMEWTKEINNGRESCISPFSTDPDSSRLRTMVQGYVEHAFEDFDDQFGDLTIYVRK